MRKHDLQRVFPNISIALKIRTASLSCERNLSTLKLSKNYLRSTMTSEIVVLAIENKTAYETNFDEFIDSFAESKARHVIL